MHLLILILSIVCFLPVASAQVHFTGMPGKAANAASEGQFQTQKNYSHTDLPPINEDYYEISTSTGGDFYFWAQGEFASPEAPEIIAKAILFDIGQEVIYDFGDLSLEVEKRRLSVPVDEGTRAIKFHVGLQSRDNINIYAPDGQEIKENDRGISKHNFTYMLITIVEEPAVGEWVIEVIGKGKYQISARTKIF